MSSRKIGFSALQRAEIAEMYRYTITYDHFCTRFSALQRAEIAEITRTAYNAVLRLQVSVLFNEPKLLKCSNFVLGRN